MKKILLIAVVAIFSTMISNCSDNCDLIVAHTCDTCGDDSKLCTASEDFIEAAQEADDYECKSTDSDVEKWEEKKKSDLDCDLDTTSSD